MTGSLCVLSEKLCVFAVKQKKNDKAIKKKAFTNLDCLGSIVACGNHCCIYGGSKKGDTGVAATTSIKDNNFSIKHSR
jgi:hypothetical protein